MDNKVHVGDMVYLPNGSGPWIVLDVTVLSGLVTFKYRQPTPDELETHRVNWAYDRAMSIL